MISFLFWNLNKRDLTERIVQLANTHELDVIVLIESGVEREHLYRALNKEKAAYNLPLDLVPEDESRFIILTRFAGEFMKPFFDLDRVTIRRLALPGIPEVLLAVMHLQSMLYSDTIHQTIESGRYAKLIRSKEKEAGHSRTVVVGDLNMNPFDSGMAAAGAFNAVMTRQITELGSREVQEEEYPFFYNPMWGRFGDTTRGPAGTFYYQSGKHVNYYWHILDQVLIRPDLLPYFNHNDLDILTDDGQNPLVASDGRPDDKAASNHLPLLFRLSL
jgi:hypothetical protein